MMRLNESAPGQRRRWLDRSGLRPALCASAIVLCLAAAARAEQPSGAASGDKAHQASIRWPFYQEVNLPQEQAPSKWCDVLVTPGVFDQARLDLGDLRLYDAAGDEIPYALRIKKPRDLNEPVPLTEFNRAGGPDGSSELTLDLGDEVPQYDTAEVPTSGDNFRRRIELEGSADGQQWRKIIEAKLVHFTDDGKAFNIRRVGFPPSRHRYLRLRIHQDPQVDKQPVTIGEVKVYHTVKDPGEEFTLRAEVQPREPVRADGGPGSAWILLLGAAQVPVEKFTAEIADAEFSRSYKIEAAGLPDSDEPFQDIHRGQWERTAGQRRRPMVASFDEQQAARLRLTVTDYSNPPLDLRSVTLSAPARQIVFVRTDALKSPLRLYYGNPKAQPPHYDIERTLPAKLEPVPARLELGPRKANPLYVPEPLPLSERWPWLIYVVLGAASVALGAILVNLGRTAVALHDQRQAVEAEE